MPETKQPWSTTSWSQDAKGNGTVHFNNGWTLHVSLASGNQKWEPPARDQEVSVEGSQHHRPSTATPPATPGHLPSLQR